jgi:DNA-binding transcriptional ArsR family regulator
VKKTEKTIKAFSNISRLKILQHLKKKKSASVIDITEATEFSYKAVSKHLIILFQADILDRKQKMYEMHYRIAKPLNPLAESIMKHI